MAKQEEAMAEVFRAGGNLPSGYVFDGRLDQVRKMTADESKAAEDAANAEQAAADSRKRVLKAEGFIAPAAPVNTEPPNAG